MSNMLCALVCKPLRTPPLGTGFLLNLHNLDKTSNSKVGARLSTLRLPGLAAYDRGTSGMNPMGK